MDCILKAFEDDTEFSDLVNTKCLDKDKIPQVHVSGLPTKTVVLESSELSRILKVFGKDFELEQNVCFQFVVQTGH